MIKNEAGRIIGLILHRLINGFVVKSVKIGQG